MMYRLPFYKLHSPPKEWRLWVQKRPAAAASKLAPKPRMRVLKRPSVKGIMPSSTFFHEQRGQGKYRGLRGGEVMTAMWRDYKGLDDS